MDDDPQYSHYGYEDEAAHLYDHGHHQPPTLIYAFTWLSSVLLYVVAVLSVACGLFYLVELTEEYSVLTKRILRVICYFEMTLFFLLGAVDNISYWRCVFSIFANWLYMRLLRNFPLCNFPDLSTVACIVAFLVDNIFWYTYFHASVIRYPTWSVAAFFVFAVWTAPIGFFVSLGLSKDQLPTSERRSRDSNRGIVSTIVSFVKGE